MSASGKATYSELADLEGVIKACNEIPYLFSDIEQGLSQHNMQHDFLRLFSEFQQKMTPSEWVMRMWQHHCKIQKSKGRFGKSNWFERYDDGSFRINPSNTIGKPIELSNEYVHGYRTQPLWSFLVNLKKVKDG